MLSDFIMKDAFKPVHVCPKLSQNKSDKIF